MTYSEIIEVFKANDNVRPDYYTEASNDPRCQSCESNLDYYSKVIDYDKGSTFDWLLVKCLRCGQTTVIKFTKRS